MRIAKSNPLIPICLLATASFAGGPRNDRWEVIGPGGGGGQFLPTVSPHNSRDVLVASDMTGAYISHDGGSSWRMFNLGDRTRFFVFDPVDAKVIYAKTAAIPPVMANDRPITTPGLFRSVDAGNTWRLVCSDSMSAGAISALAVDPADSHILYAAFEFDRSSSLHISADWGKHWRKSGGLPQGGDQIYVDPRSPKSDRSIYVLGAGSVSVREGGRWRRGEVLKGMAPQGRPELRSRVVAAGFSEQDGKLVAYQIAASRLHVSDDGGATWRSAPLPDHAPRLVPVAVGTSLRHPDTVYVSYVAKGQNPFGVAKSTDRGRTWKLVWEESARSAPNVHDTWLSERWGPGWGGNPLFLGVAPLNPDICFGTDYGRTLRTTDGGKSWWSVYSTKLADGTNTTTGLDVTTNYGVHFDPFDLKRVFISYDDIGLLRSENGGKSWRSSITGVPQSWANSTYWIEFDPLVRGRVWAVMSGVHSLPRHKFPFLEPATPKTPGGVCRSDDGARTWNCSSEGMPETAATHILLDPNSPAHARVLYVAGFGQGVYKTVDGGGHWVLKNDGIVEQQPLAWRLVRDSGGVLYLVVVRRNDDGRIGGEGDGAIYRSTDGAEHWTRVALPEGVNGPHGLAVDARDPRRLYLAAWGRHPGAATAGSGIFLSADRGATWRPVLAQDQYVYDVTIDPRDPRILYACGFSSSAWRSADRGETWQRIKGFNFKWGHRVIPDSADPAKIYITTYGGSVWHGPAAGDDSAAGDVVPDNGPPRVPAPPSAWTPGISMRIHRVGAVVPSPDGRLVAYTESRAIVNSTRNQWVAQLFLARPDGSHRRQLTHHEDGISSPAFSPDGHSIYFLSGPSHQVNVWRVAVEGGDAQRITGWQGALHGYQISPDGKWIALRGAQAQGPVSMAAGRVFGEGIRNDSLWVMPAEAAPDGSRPLQRLTQAPDHIANSDWSPDSRSIAYEHRPDSGENTWPRSDVSEVEVATGRVRVVAAGPAGEGEPRYSPDGRYLAYLRTAGTASWAGEEHIVLVPRDGGAPRVLPDTFDDGPSIPGMPALLPRKAMGEILGWSSDSKRLLFTGEKGTRSVLYSVGLDGATRALYTPKGVVDGAALNASGTHAGFSQESSTEPPEAFVMSLEAQKPTQVSAANAGLPSLPLGETRPIRWISPDGLPIEGLLTLPAGYQTGRTYPLLVVVHGGPMGWWNESFIGDPDLYPFASFAAKGYATLRPNIRGSGGYGKTFRFANRDDWGGRDYEDMLAGVDHLIAARIADPDRLAIMGWSYGGYMTSWTITHTKRFKAAIEGAGVTNLWSFAGTTDILEFLPDYLTGQPWDRLQLYLERSPMYHVKGVTTPTLILHGDADLRVPISQGHELYNALKRQGVPTKMVIYPGRTHVPDDPAAELDIMNRHLEWLEQYLR